MFVICRRLEVFDQEGSIIDTIPINSFREGEVVSLQHSLYEGQVYPLIVKDQLVAITQHKRWQTIVYIWIYWLKIDY